MKVSYKLILWFWWEWLSILKVSIIASLLCPYNISRKKIEIRLVFLHVEKHQSFLQVDFNALGIKVSYKVIPSFLIGMIKHSQSTQSNKFARPNSFGLFLDILRKKYRNCFCVLLWCRAFRFRFFYGGPVMFVVICFSEFFHRNVT